MRLFGELQQWSEDDFAVTSSAVSLFILALLATTALQRTRCKLASWRAGLLEFVEYIDLQAPPSVAQVHGVVPGRLVADAVVGGLRAAAAAAGIGA
jgi:hypothetical protein